MRCTLCSGSGEEANPPGLSDVQRTKDSPARVCRRNTADDQLVNDRRLPRDHRSSRGRGNTLASRVQHRFLKFKSFACARRLQRSTELDPLARGGEGASSLPSYVRNHGSKLIIAPLINVGDSVSSVFPISVPCPAGFYYHFFYVVRVRGGAKAWVRWAIVPGLFQRIGRIPPSSFHHSSLIHLILSLLSSSPTMPKSCSQCR